MEIEPVDVDNKLPQIPGIPGTALALIPCRALALYSAGPGATEGIKQLILTLVI